MLATPFFRKDFMSERLMNQFPLTFEKKVKSVFAKVTFGSSGAPTLDAANSKGILSVTRNSTGTYTFVFGTTTKTLDTYVKLLNISHIVNSGTSAPAAPSFYVKANTSNAIATAAIQIVTNLAGTATDPASGEIMYFEFKFGDSTAP